MPISVPDERLADYGGDREHFHHVLEFLHIPAVEAAGFTAIEPIAKGADLIHAEIIKQLDSADLVLCDMSTRNPNVFFELGIRTALNKPVCMVRDVLTTHVPFDTGVLNYETYQQKLDPWHLKTEVPKLTKHISAAVQRSGKKNPMWQYFGLATPGSFAKAAPTGLEDQISLLASRVEDIATRMNPPTVNSPSKAKASFHILRIFVNGRIDEILTKRHLKRKPNDVKVEVIDERIFITLKGDAYSGLVEEIGDSVCNQANKPTIVTLISDNGESQSRVFHPPDFM